MKIHSGFYLLLLIFIAFNQPVQGQNIDTLLTLKSAFQHESVFIHDMKLLQDGSVSVIFELEREIFYVNSKNPADTCFINFQVWHPSKSRQANRRGLMIKNPRFSDNGNLIVAISDLDKDDRGGRFYRWDVIQKQLLPELQTGHWGIQTYAVSNNGRWFVNYWHDNIPSHAVVIDAQTQKSFKINRKEIFFTDTIYFSADDKFLVFKNTIQKGKLRDMVYSTENFKEVDLETTPLSSVTSGVFIKKTNDDFYLKIKNDSLLAIKTASINKEIALKGIKLLAIDPSTSAFVMAVRTEQNQYSFIWAKTPGDLFKPTSK